jgi:type II secretory pathway pseudopilin PulG
MLPSGWPSGWIRLEQLNLNKGIQEAVLTRFDLAAREINPSVNHSIDLAFHVQKGAPQAAPTISLLLHHNLLAAMIVPGVYGIPQKAALAQSEADLAMVACALERYRLAQGQYPGELNALIPRFAAALPHDIINGQPLKYSRTDNGRFILYSVGWNEKDDGGVVAATRDNPQRQDTQQGDWVWQYPDKP